MCTIVSRLSEDRVEIAANRDEMLARPWAAPAQHWPDLPGVVGGLDSLAGGTWLGINRHGVVAAVLNRRGSLGPAPGKRSRGELPLLALAARDASAGAARVAAVDAGLYRSFNVVIADRKGAFLLRGLEAGRPEPERLPAGTWMVTSGEPNDPADPRIARHLPRFAAAPFAAWPALLADATGPLAAALNIPETGGFGTVSSAVILLPGQGPPVWRFAAGPPHHADFATISLEFAMPIVDHPGRPSFGSPRGDAATAGKLPGTPK